MKNAPRNKYNEVVEQCKQAETIITLNVDLVLANETLSHQWKKWLTEIENQIERIDKLLEKIK